MPGKIKALYRVVEKTAMKRSMEKKLKKRFCGGVIRARK
jgi:hypothetical protein